MPPASLGAALQFHSALRCLQRDHADISDTTAPYLTQMQGNMPSGALRHSSVQGGPEARQQHNAWLESAPILASSRCSRCLRATWASMSGL